MQESAIGMVTTLNPTPLLLRAKTYEVLEPHIIDLIDLASRIRNAHWNIRQDPGFKPLHELFGELYEEINDIIDLLAERLIQFGFTVQGHITLVSERTRLPSMPLVDNNAVSLCSGISTLLNTIGQGLLEDLSKMDAVTSNMVEEVIQQLEKQLWMVESHIPILDVMTQPTLMG